MKLSRFLALTGAGSINMVVICKSQLLGKTTGGETAVILKRAVYAVQFKG